jgi:hypothetical protein
METLIHSFQLYEQVSLKKDIPKYHLKKGDVGTLVDVVPHPEGLEDGAVLEIFNALGESMYVVAVSVSDINQLLEDEILSVRKIAV